MENRRRQVVCAAAVFLMLGSKYLQQRSKRKRRWWMTSLAKNRSRYTPSDMLQDLAKEPSGYFENFCRMSSEDFEFLLAKTSPKISKQDTNMRISIPAIERFAVTLRFLATGDSFKSLGYLFKMSKDTVSNCVKEVCQALTAELKDEIKLPTTVQEWINIATDFQRKWDFNHCIGALDGKHITIEAPSNSGTEFFNYKGTFSIVLMALVDAKYCFIFADVGCQCRISDGGVFRNTLLFKKLQDNDLNIPLDAPLSQFRSMPVPYVIVADDAFALETNIMKPYPGTHDKGSVRRIFNYRCSRARRVVENAFGIMSAVFRVLRKPMLLDPEKASLITMTCLYLHNFLRKSRSSSTRYTPVGTLDSETDGILIEGSWRQEPASTSFLPLRKIARKTGIEGNRIRDEFADFYANEGRVAWQADY